MAILTTPIHSKSFPADLDLLAFTSQDEKPFDAVLSVDGKSIMNVTLYPDERGEASLCSIASLIQTYLQDQPKTVTVGTMSESGSQTTETVCYPCNVRIDMDAPEFFEDHFLTLAKGPIDTYAGSIEYLGVAADAAPSILEIYAYFCDDSGQIAKVVIDGQTITMENGIGVLEIKVDDIQAKKPDALLMEFVVVADHRILRFRVQGREADGEHLTFINAFGIPQHIYFPMVETKMQPEKQQARINGLLCNYKIERKCLFHGAAQMIAPTMEDIYEDFLMSKTIYRQRDNVTMVLDSGEVVHSTESSVGGAAKATWREASPFAMYHPSRMINTFDDTFDQTFR